MEGSSRGRGEGRLTRSADPANLYGSAVHRLPEHPLHPLARPVERSCKIHIVAVRQLSGPPRTQSSRALGSSDTVSLVRQTPVTDPILTCHTLHTSPGEPSTDRTSRPTSLPSAFPGSTRPRRHPLQPPPQCRLTLTFASTAVSVAMSIANLEAPAPDEDGQRG